MDVPGLAGYREHADTLLSQYDAVKGDDLHGHMLEHYPAPCSMLELGAGPGRDALWFAERGYQVTAVEPLDAFRNHGEALTKEHDVRWIDDALPHLANTPPIDGGYSLITATAVWMHLDAGEQAIALKRVKDLVSPGGVLALTIRHGPVPKGRVMFEIPDADMRALAEGHSFAETYFAEEASVLPANLKAGVTWSRFLFKAT